MSHRLAVLTLAAMLLLVGVLFAACSSDSDDTDDGGAGTDATEPADDGDGDANTDATEPPDDGDVDGDGDADDDGTGSDRNEGGDEQRVAAAVADLYGHVSDGDYDALWSVYTSAFQGRCSFDDMVSFTEELRQSEGWSELLPTQIKVDVLDDRAVADYVVIQTSSDGFAIGEYEYTTVYFYENGEWRAEETCF